jgi:mannosyl-3-phosphoglycerate phosphatase
MKQIIFTDLDGTLLDGFNYSFKKVLPYLKILKEKKIPVVFCTCKTQAENEYFQKKLKNNTPFIAENGGAIFIPKNYFSYEIASVAASLLPRNDKVNIKSSKNYFIIELGEPYKKLRIALNKIKKETGFKIKGFGDMSAKEVSEDSGLSIEMAKLAKKKDYNESFKFDELTKEEKILFEKIKKAGFNFTHGGRYYNIFGKNAGKGKAVKILAKLFQKEFGKIKTIGLGDSLNDLSMLKVVDIPILVKNKNGIWNPKINFSKLHRINGVGPEGWVKGIERFVLK